MIASRALFLRFRVMMLLTFEVQLRLAGLGTKP